MVDNALPSKYYLAISHADTNEARSGNRQQLIYTSVIKGKQWS